MDEELETKLLEVADEEVDGEELLLELLLDGELDGDEDEDVI